MAPEVLLGIPYTISSDIWSLGILIYELCTLTPLIQANTMESLLTKVRSSFSHYHTRMHLV